MLSGMCFIEILPAAMGGGRARQEEGRGIQRWPWASQGWTKGARVQRNHWKSQQEALSEWLLEGRQRPEMASRSLHKEVAAIVQPPQSCQWMRWPWGHGAQDQAHG